jgi:PTH2 family peptidyl-tRNA hydrolase
MKTKQIIIIRKDLNMRKGKMVAQGAHASMACIFNYMKQVGFSGTQGNGDGSFLLVAPEAMTAWINGRFTKICVYVNSEKELVDLYNKAKDEGLPCSLIKDAGLTEFKEPTLTAVGIGPAKEKEVDAITGTLPLL